MATDGVAGDGFGSTVAVSGETSIIGAPLHGDLGRFSGAAYVFVRSGTTWLEQAKLLASDGAEGARFGWDVAVNGETAIVGAPYEFYQDNSTLPPAGSVYVFVRAGTTWSEQAKLTPNDSALGDRFGGSVSISGDTAVVGAVYDDWRSTGSVFVYVFVRNGTSWSQEAKLNLTTLGSDVSVDGDTLVAGEIDQSAAVFVRNGTNWSQQAKLTVCCGYYPGYGKTFASISGDIAAVEFRDYQCCEVFTRTEVFTRSGSTWSEGWYVDEDRLWGLGLGASVSGDAVVSAAYDGSAFVFHSGSCWCTGNEPTRLITSDGRALRGSVSVSGDIAVIGATDSAYVFDLSGPLAPTSILNRLDAYWQHTTPFTLTATATGVTGGVAQVDLLVMFSSDNSTWSQIPGATVQSAPFSFTYSPTSGDGFYRFWTIARDGAGNVESWQQGYYPDYPPPEVEVGLDTTAPMVTSSDPAQSANTVSASKIRISFSEPVDHSVAEAAFTIEPSTEGTFSWQGNDVIFTPVHSLQADTTYAVRIGAAGIIDRAGNIASQDFMLAFRTALQAAPTHSYAIAVSTGVAELHASELTTITATLTDNEAPVIGASVDIAASPADAGQLSGTTSTTDAYGHATFTFRAGAVAADTTVTFTVTASNGTDIGSLRTVTLTLLAQPQASPTPLGIGQTWVFTAVVGASVAIAIAVAVWSLRRRRTR